MQQPPSEVLARVLSSHGAFFELCLLSCAGSQLSLQSKFLFPDSVSVSRYHQAVQRSPWTDDSRFEKPPAGGYHWARNIPRACIPRQENGWQDGEQVCQDPKAEGMLPTNKRLVTFLLLLRGDDYLPVTASSRVCFLDTYCRCVLPFCSCWGLAELSGSLIMSWVYQGIS